MPRPRGNGLVVKTYTRADGTESQYIYNRHTKTKYTSMTDALAGLSGAPTTNPDIPAIPEIKPWSLRALVVDYKRTDKYRVKKPNTKEIYSRYMEQLVIRFGDMPVKLIDEPWVERLKLDLQDTPSKANNTLRMLRILLSVGAKFGYGANRAANNPGLIHEPSRDEVWDPENEARFIAAAPAHLKLAFMLLLYTAQRQSDVLDMSISRIRDSDGRLLIALKQHKTDTLLDVPVHRDLEPLIRARMADIASGVPTKKGGTVSLLLVPSPTGLKWARRNFSRAWDAVKKLAWKDAAENNIKLTEKLQRRDLRRTAVVRMAQAGLPTPQIAAITGHEIDYCQKIINRYLPRRTEVAMAGIEAWERSSAGTVARMASGGNHGN